MTCDRRFACHPKVHIADTGLAAHVLGKDPASLRRPTDPARGPLIETFVVDELLRQTSFLDEPEVRLHHLRDRDGAEVDIIAEASDGRVVAVDVKASRSVNPADGKWLAWLRNKIGDDFACGIVLHTGDRTCKVDLKGRNYHVRVSGHGRDRRVDAPNLEGSAAAHVCRDVAATERHVGRLQPPGLR